MEERRRGPLFLGDCESESFLTVILYFALVLVVLSVLDKGSWPKVLENKFENL